MTESTISRRSFLAGASLLAGSALIGATGCTPSASIDETLATTGDAQATAGTGTAQGRNGELTVRAIVEGDQLTDIQIVRSHETMSVGETAQDILRGLIIGNQTLNVDAVSGATLTSMAYLAAVEEALQIAGQDTKEWKKRDHASLPREEALPTSTDVVIVGSGGAALSAAITAAKESKSVVVLEKMGIFGGSTSLSGFGFAAPGSWPQQQAGVEDSPDKLAEDMLAGGDYEGNPELVHTLCDNALDAYQWLTYDVMVPWYPGVIQDGGHSCKRSQCPVDYGAGTVQKLLAGARTAGASLFASAQVDEIVKNADGAIAGVRGTDLLTGDSFEIAAPAVVLATGGFGRNIEMRVQYNPKFDDSYMCTDAPGITGDGLIMAEAAGAQLVDMDFIQTHPTGNPSTGSMLDVGGVRAYGNAIMVNKEGKRFVEELERRDVVSKATLAQTDGLGYFVFSHELAEADDMYGWAGDEIDAMKAAGYWIEGDTLEEACAAFGINAAECAKAIDQWNADCEAGADSAFNYRGDMSPIGGAPYCIFATTPTVHYTMGGVAIDTEARVLDAADKPIPGLYAAGEVTGDIMGTNRLGTTAVVDIVVFGRIAGRNAATLA
ncbi:flavocytochrome c [Eggerthellaceae bacterium 24-137]